MLFPLVKIFPCSSNNRLIWFPADISIILAFIALFSIFPVCANPHSPYVFIPHVYTIPFVVSARLWLSPQEIFAMSLIPSIFAISSVMLYMFPFSVSISVPDTCIAFSGIVFLVGVFVFPSPQVYISPSCVIATLMFLYADISFMLLKLSIFIGLFEFSFFPFPSCPFVPNPHAYTSPVFVSAKLCEYPVLIFSMFCNSFICVCFSFCSLSPVPSSPFAFVP